ncbi:MAG: hypothetical protein RR198_06715 [Oscillospiraceae bacterium]
MDNKRAIFRGYLVVVISQMVIGVGVGMIVFSNMGNDPMGVFISGLSGKTGISFGAMTNIYSLAVFVFLLIFYRKRLSLTTLITAVAVGFAIEPVLKFLRLFTFPTFVNNYIFPILGCGVVGLGVACYLCLDMGASITDNLILFICDITKRGYPFGCYLIYFIYFTIGLLLGGVWGYATLVSLFFTGRVVDFLMPKFKNTIGKWVFA